MICPVCRGRGEVRKRFIFFTWRRRCSKCGGTGQLGAVPVRDLDERYEDRRSDYFRVRTITDERIVTEPDRFDAGSGGRSGGGGGGAGWDDAAVSDDRENPVIVDPFAGDAVTAEAASDAEAPDVSGSSESGDSGSDSSSSDSGSGQETGTSY